MELKSEAQGRIRKPLAEVYDAVYNPKKLSGYFVTAGAGGPMDEGRKVMWEFADFPGAFPVFVKKNVKNEKIVFEWEANDGAGGAGYMTTVQIDFSAVDSGTTLVKISETGWREDRGGLKGSIGNSQGWMQMLCCLKAYAEYGINLREGFFA
ncbi:MAG TPA: SRPBCC domain-containing protein [Pseudobdellovibrionaceae bacterium]|nr:SRPBCC domain-containing protein [Pseudobdellovibrionaceae bacterium]